jgi:putative flippase GtrA
MGLVRQIMSFGAVGVAATVTHVAIAWLLIVLANCDPYVANLFGTLVAFAVSFGGNVGFTFQSDRKLWSSARRYLLVSSLSLVTTTTILMIVERTGLPTYVYVIGVLAFVPPTTFVLAKHWAFHPA